jgi:uncharacterized membrane protein
MLIRDTYAHQPASFDIGSRTALRWAAQFWFAVTAIGMWIFVLYVARYYAPLLFAHGPVGLAEAHLPNGYVEGDPTGNVAMLAHLLLAILIIGGGPLQLIPWIRGRLPRFHRINGRIYVATAALSALAGLYMVWTRGTVGGPALKIGISLDGLLILLFAVQTVRYAVARDIATHRRWALRLFLVTSAVWFYRVGLMGWMMTTKGIGVDMKTFSGPFLDILAYAQYLLPLAVMEIYFRAKQSFGAGGRYTVASTLFVLTLLEAVGIFAATMVLWLPRL